MCSNLKNIPVLFLVFFLLSSGHKPASATSSCNCDCPAFAPISYYAQTFLHAPNGGVRLLIQVGSDPRTDITDGVLVFGSPMAKLQPNQTVFVNGRSNNTNGIGVTVTGVRANGATEELHNYQTGQGHIVFSFQASTCYTRYLILLTDE